MQNDAEITAAVKRINEGKATYKEVEDLAYRVGVDLSKALKGHITNEIMPEGHVPQNVAEKILQPTLREAHGLVIEAATKTQEAMNKAAGIGLKALAAEFDEEKAQGLVHKLTNGLLDETGWILDAPVTSFVQSSADRTLKKNVKFQARAGLKPRITREAEGGCCPWCSKLEGSYDYGDEPDDIYRRHRRCRCVVDYRPGDGRRQDVWSKAWHEDAEPEKVEERKRKFAETAMKKNTSTSWSQESKKISKEKYDELLMFASEKGIELRPTFRNFDGDPELVKEFITSMAKNLGNRRFMRKNKIGLDVSYVLKDDTYAVTNGGVITINGFAYRKRELLQMDYEKRVAEGWFTEGSSYKNISDHESAHVIVNMNQLKKKGLVESIFGRDLESALNSIQKNISEYATVSKDEIIAEAYVKYVNGSKDKLILQILRYCGIL